MILPDYRRGKLSIRDGAKMPCLELGEGDPEVLFILEAGDGISTAYDAASSRLIQAHGHLHGADLESPRYPQEFERFVDELREEEGR